MKRIPLAVVALALVAAVIYAAWPRPVEAPGQAITPVASTPTPNPNESPGPDTSFFEATVNDPARLKVILGNTSLKVPEMNVRVSLRSGSGTYTDGPVRGTVTLVNVLGTRKAQDGSYDAFADIASDSGGSGTFRYVVLFRLTAQTIEDTSAVFIGDRVHLLAASPGSEDTQGYRLTVTYLDRGPNDPFSADPTIAKQATFVVREHKISKQ